MRNPNGYGAIVNLGKGRRKPFGVRLTTNYTLDVSDGTPKATQKYKYIGYYATRKEAMLALVKYNANPYDLSLSDITFGEVFDIWFKDRFADGEKPATYYSYSAAFKKCGAIKDMKLRDIKTVHLQKLFTPDLSKSSLNNICIICNYVFEWGLQNDIINKNYVQYITMPKAKETNKHTIFTTEEISVLWDNKDNSIAQIALMLIYSGLRIGEFMALTENDINLNKKCIIIGKSKTKAGIRTVPIADKTLTLWKKWQPVTASASARREWAQGMKELGLNHLFHDTRYTCVSLLTAAEVPMPIVQKIVGHSGKNVTENVYLHLELPTLLEAINKI